MRFTALALLAHLAYGQADWPTFGRDAAGTRYSTLKQIDTKNVDKLGLTWSFDFDEIESIESTPLVADGVMYVTAADKVCALGAGTGRELWCFAYTEPT